MTSTTRLERKNAKNTSEQDFKASCKLFREKYIQNTIKIMLNVLAYFLLLLALICKTTLEQLSNDTTGAPSPAPLLPPALSQKPDLPKIEVDAVNRLFRLMSTSKVSMPNTFSSTDCCSKNRTDKIRCKPMSNTCRVVEIDLSGQGLRGYIPPEIGNLPYLTSLDLSSNRLRGSIPNSFANLSQLSTLDLYSNKLRGPIPNSFANLSRLSELDLSDNMLEGRVPKFLGELESLRILALSDNWFNGSIPSELGSLPSLEVLYLDSNDLSGGVPVELGNISSLIKLDLSDTELSGKLPQQLGDLGNLRLMSLTNMFLDGELPSSFEKLKKLEYFIIQGTNISGTIPEFISSWKNLESLVLTGNNFEGPLPTEISALANLHFLFITDLAGGGTGASFPNIRNMVSLETLSLRNCLLSGPIPDFIWNFENLSYLDLSFNKLTGRIPAVVKLQSPKYIFLRRNKLSGTLPQWLTNLNQSYVDVSDNSFANVTLHNSSVSPYLNLFQCCSNESNVNLEWQKAEYYCANRSQTYNHLYINCGGNATTINGSNYEADLQPYGGSTFILSDNGTWAYSSMGTFLTANHDQYKLQRTCNISMADAPLYVSARIAPISLKYYGFCLENDEYIVRLHFAEIAFDEIKYSRIRKRVFDVEIQGGQHYLRDFNIEEEAGGVNTQITKEFRVTINHSRLEIHLYWSGKGSMVDQPQYYGPLISAISVSPAPRDHKLPPAIIGIIAGSATLFVILILALSWKLGWLGGKKGEELKAIELFPGGVFNFQQIKAATKNFNPENKIGEGGFGAVYKGVLPNGTQVAIKQLAAKSKQGAQEFINEIGTTYVLQHPNLVRLIGCCAEKNELLLVYEYMENNSLEHVLFGPEEVKSRLNWLMRVRICRDVAKGLAFLHEESKLKIIHRDIKPTNILLDKDFTAKISDFGYAQLNEDEKTRVVTRIAGTTGYMAPEYVQGFLTPKADVYSFGIVVLEIISGKNISTFRPKDQTVYLLDMAYDYQKQGNMIALVDASLGSEYTYSEALTILNLAMECVSPAPKLRPSMSEVVKVLEGIVKAVESKRKTKTTFPSTTAKPLEAFSESTQSGSTANESALDTTISHSFSKEIDDLNTSTGQFSEIGKPEITPE